MNVQRVLPILTVAVLAASCGGGSSAKTPTSAPATQPAATRTASSATTSAGSGTAAVTATAAAAPCTSDTTRAAPTTYFSTAEAGSGVIGTVPVGEGPVGMDIDPQTGHVFVAVTYANSVAVLDARATPPVALGTTIATGKGPHSVAVDPTTGHVFVTNELDCTVSVIDGRAASPAIIGNPIRVGNGPRGITLDPTTGRVFVVNKDSVSTIDGRATTPVLIGAPIPAGLPYQAAVDPQTGRVFVGNFGTSGSGASNGTGSIYVIDGRANPPALIGQPISTDTPTGLAVDPTSGRVFVANNGLINTVSVLEGRAATPAFLATTIAVPLNPIGVMVDPVKGLVFVASSGTNPPTAGSGALTIIDTSNLAVVGKLNSLQFPLFGVSDSSSGRVFVGEIVSRRVLVLDAATAGR